MVGLDEVLADQREKRGIAGGPVRSPQTLFLAAGHRYVFRRVTGEGGVLLEISDQDDPEAVMEVPLSGWKSFLKTFTDLMDRTRTEAP